MNETGDLPAWLTMTRAAHRVEAQLEEALDAVGLSLSKFGLLKVLMSAGQPLPLSDLARRFGCVKSNVTQLVDRLEADGLVERRDDPDDRRSVRAALTRDGEKKFRQAARVLADADAKLFAPLQPHEVAMLGDLLSRLDPGC
ncbi:MAG: MarR family winged helix-turn-helix transcriptional regulator [Candidatus Xenobia bacterium]